MQQPKEWHNGFHDVQCFIQLRGVPESRRPINFPGPRTHLVIVRTRRRLLCKARALHKGDWIATGIDGEHWAIADDIFRRTYERCD